MSLSEKFKFKHVRLSNRQKINIHSNWLLIFGGLKEFTNQEERNKLNKYGIIHMIRQIDGYNYYPITHKLFVLLMAEMPEELKTLRHKDVGFVMNSSLRTKFNKLLKQKDIRDKNGKLESIQIEHLNGGVKNLVEKIVSEKLDKIEDLETIHRDYTLCCYKLKSESNIDELTNLDEIKLAAEP
jgi:DNA replication protein DnaD